MTSLYLFLATAPKESHEQQLLDLDWTLAVQLGVFVLLVLLLTPLLWRPYLRVRRQRVERIEGGMADAQRLEAEAGLRVQKVEQALHDARREAARERERVQAEAQALESEMFSKAQAEAHAMLTSAGTRLQSSIADERSKLMPRAQELGRSIVRQVLGREVS